MGLTGSLSSTGSGCPALSRACQRTGLEECHQIGQLRLEGHHVRALAPFLHQLLRPTRGVKAQLGRALWLGRALRPGEPTPEGAAAVQSAASAAG